MFEFDKLPNGMIALKPLLVKPSDIIKMRSTLKSFLRDWAKEVILNLNELILGRIRKKNVLLTNNG